MRLFNFWINWFTSVPSRLNGDVEIWQEQPRPFDDSRGTDERTGRMRRSGIFQSASQWF